MARIRCIRPEVHTTATIVSLSDLAWRVLFGVAPLADDVGRCLADVDWLNGQLFWAKRSRDDVAAALGELEVAQLVVMYDVGGTAYLEIVGWGDDSAPLHQRIEKPGPSKFPPPPGRSRSVPGTLRESSGSVPGGKGEEGKGGDRKGPSPSQDEAAAAGAWSAPPRLLELATERGVDPAATIRKYELHCEEKGKPPTDAGAEKWILGERKPGGARNGARGRHKPNPDPKAHARRL